MKKRARWLVQAMLAGTLTIAMPTGVTQAADQTLVFDHVNVVDVKKGQILPDMRVLIVNGVIDEVVSSENAKPLRYGGEVIDASGKYLMPGLYDLHVHLGGDAKALAPLYLANGVTAVRDMGSTFEDLAALREWERGGALLPTVLKAGPVIDGGKDAATSAMRRTKSTKR